MTLANYKTIRNDDINTAVPNIRFIFTCNLLETENTRELLSTSREMAYDNTFLVGKRFPNRLFVGGLPPPVTAPELASFFSNFGSVVDSKVILDEEGVSKGYGFVSFKSAQDVKNVGQMGTLFLRNKKLNIGPAVKKEGPTVSPETVIVPSAPSKGEYFYPIPQQQQSVPSMHYVQEPQPVMWYYYFPPMEQAQYNNIYQLQHQVANYQIIPEAPYSNNYINDSNNTLNSYNNAVQRKPRRNLPPRLKSKRSN